MKTLAAFAILAALATPAAAQGWQYQTTPLGGGWSTTQAQGPNGQHVTGTTVPMGGGWNTTTWQDNSGHSSTCTTMPMGGGYTTTTCQ